MLDGVETLSTLGLNRALLARQFLLKRELVLPLRVIEHLGGLQAQQSRPPFTGLWSRIDGFEAEDLRQLLRDRKVLRATTMRGTLHLVSKTDFQAWRPLLQPMLSAGAQSILRDRLQTFDPAAVLSHATERFQRGPRTFNALRDELVAKFPDGDERAMGYFVRMHLPLSSVPEDDNAFDLVPDVTSQSPDGGYIENFITRYLGAFGPATIADFQAWSGMKGAKPVFESMNLLTFRDEKKRVLYDLPGAPRPAPETPAPVRLIAEFDNLVLGHADRSRIVSDAYRPRIVTRNLLVLGTFLVNGFVAGTWKRDGKKIKLDPFEPLPPKVKKAVQAEAEALPKFD